MMDKPWACIFFIIIGILLLKVYFDRDKNNSWGEFYRMYHVKWDKEDSIGGKIRFLFMGWLCIWFGLTCFLGLS